MKFSNKLILTIGLVCSLTACSPNKTSDEYLQSAQQSIIANDNASAIIAIKNAISINRENAEARFLLGDLYLRQGESASAEKELQLAIDLGKGIDLVLPKLLKSLNLQDKNSDILPMIALHKDGKVELLPQVLFYAGLANLDAGDKGAAKSAFIRANEISPESIYSKLGSAYLKVASQDIDEALFKIEDVLNEDSSISEAYLLKAHLLHSKNDYSNAVQAFQKYHKLLPKDLKVRMFLARDLIQGKQFSEATKHLDYLMKIFPEQPYVNQLKGIIAFKEGNYQSSLGFTEKAMQKGIDSSPNRIVAGVSAFNLQRYELAHQYLLNVADQLRDNHPVKKILAMVQMQLGYTDDASNILGDLEVLSVEDISLLTAASYELLKSGKFDDAKFLLDKTQSIPEIDAQGMIRVGILQLSMNDLDGITNLEKALEISPELPMAKMALAAAYIKNKEYDKALYLAKQWKQSSPDKIEGFNLAAKSYLLKKDIEAAEIELNLASEINENSPYSLLYFSNKAIENDHPEESIKLLEKLFVASPNHLTGLVLNYRAHKVLNTSNVAIEKIAASFAENQQNLSYRLLYARVLFIDKKYQDVITLLKDIEASVSSPFWGVLGDSYARLNENEKALSVYDDWIKVQPQYKVAWLRKISIQEKITDYNGALSTVEQVLEKSPNDDQFNVLRANYLILAKQYKKAQIQIDSLSVNQRKFPIVKGLQGKLWLVEGNTEKALSGIEALYNLLPNPFNTVLLFTVYKKLDQEPMAFNFLKKHVESFPEDSTSRKVLAENAIIFDQELSKKHYTILLKSSPDNIYMLNNLAWVEYQLANYVEANSLISKALKLDSNVPQILDTAGVIQLKLGNKQKAIKLLKKAHLLAPNDKSIEQHYQETVTK